MSNINLQFLCKRCPFQSSTHQGLCLRPPILPTLKTLWETFPSGRTGIFLPDSMDEADIMRSKVLEQFNNCFNDIKWNFTLILSEVKRWIKDLRSTSDASSFQKYIANKFRLHMEFGTQNDPLKKIDDRKVNLTPQRVPT